MWFPQVAIVLAPLGLQNPVHPDHRVAPGRTDPSGHGEHRCIRSPYLGLARPTVAIGTLSHRDGARFASFVERHSVPIVARGSMLPLQRVTIVGLAARNASITASVPSDKVIANSSRAHHSLRTWCRASSRPASPAGSGGGLHLRADLGRDGVHRVRHRRVQPPHRRLAHRDLDADLVAAGRAGDGVVDPAARSGTALASRCGPSRHSATPGRGVAEWEAAARRAAGARRSARPECGVRPRKATTASPRTRVVPPRRRRSR